MSQEHHWDEETLTTSAPPKGEALSRGAKERPSLVEMTREQYENLLARALGRHPRRDDH